MNGILRRVLRILPLLTLLAPGPLPVRKQLLAMDGRPFGNERECTSRQRAGDQLDWIKAKHRHVILIIRVKVGQVVRRADFHVHPDDDAEKAAQLRHSRQVYSSAGALRMARAFIAGSK